MYLQKHAICSVITLGLFCLFLTSCSACENSPAEVKDYSSLEPTGTYLAQTSTGTTPWTLTFSADSSTATLTFIQGDSTIVITYAVTDNDTHIVERDQ